MIEGPATGIMKVLDGVENIGEINTSEEKLSANVQHSIRLQHKQVWYQPPQPDRVLLVGGGPSLESTLDELRHLYFAGGKVVTVNGSYQWCIERNIKPSAQIVLDARPENARFVDPEIPECRYLVASQCAPETWARVSGRPRVFIWHATAGDNPLHKPVLDDYYMGNWMPSPGGTTVIMRAITLLRAQGFLRFDLFGVDSCFIGDDHHAYDQPENDADRPQAVRVFSPKQPEMSRTFLCAPWMIKQLEDFLQMIRLHGDHFLINVHGDGILAYALRWGYSADVEIDAAAEGVSSGKE